MATWLVPVQGTRCTTVTFLPIAVLLTRGPIPFLLRSVSVRLLIRTAFLEYHFPSLLEGEGKLGPLPEQHIDR